MRIYPLANSIQEITIHPPATLPPHLPEGGTDQGRPRVDLHGLDPVAGRGGCAGPRTGRGVSPCRKASHASTATSRPRTRVDSGCGGGGRCPKDENQESDREMGWGRIENRGARQQEQAHPRQFTHPAAQQAHKVAEANAKQRKVHPLTSGAEPSRSNRPSRTHRTRPEVVKVEQGIGGSEECFVGWTLHAPVTAAAWEVAAHAHPTEPCSRPDKFPAASPAAEALPPCDAACFRPPAMSAPRSWHPSARHARHGALTVILF